MKLLKRSTKKTTARGQGIFRRRWRIARPRPRATASSRPQRTEQAWYGDE
jgi:hypothetical protein